MVSGLFPMLLTFLILSTPLLAGVDHVIVISIDGGKPASILNSKMPVLNSMVAEGGSTFRAKTIMPSLTLPSHVSMLTGVSPGVHKITWNMWNPLYGSVRVPTVFSLAKKSGFSTALFATKDKFKHLQVKDSLDRFSLEATDAMTAAQLASEYLKESKPKLLFVHLPDSDVAGHAYGWESRVKSS
jgi:predicted AlkP superfamily pyrophosphatase or phosphodiesterase